MLSELAVGHSYTQPRRAAATTQGPVPGGLLGADYEIADGRYRFKKVYGGLNWTPDLRSPLTAPGVDVKAGEYLLAVRGIDLKPPTEVYSLFENTAGKSIEITVGPNADGKGSRTVTVEPLASESALRNLDWVEGNLKKVHEATNGRVAYVYVPNTAGPGHEYFKRYFFPQADKDAIIVDERFNGGGQVADYYIDHLRRPFTAIGRRATARTSARPAAAIFGPKVMLIDETAGSGGDLLPWMFRQYKLGPAGRQADLGRAGRHPRLPGADGRRRRDGPEPRVLDAEGRLRRRERGRAAGRRGRAWPAGRDRRQGPAAGEGDRDRPGGAEEEPAEEGRATALPAPGEAVDSARILRLSRTYGAAGLARA